MLRKGFKKDFLIFLAALVDEFEYNAIRYRIWRSATGEDYRPQSSAKLLSKILSVGDIEKIEKNGEVFIRLTSKGWDNLTETIPIFKLSKSAWDGYWRIVIFDIEEKYKNQRDALRRKLLSLGFGMWQKSVYITPYKVEDEINEYFRACDLESLCFCLVARRSDLGNDKVLVEKVWQLEKLNAEYEEFIFQCQEFLKESDRKEKLNNPEKLWARYKDLILKDPHLPKQLLPENWKAVEAKKSFLKFSLR